MATNRDSQSKLFTLRLWQEKLGEDQWEWRGEVKDTSTGQRRYFRDWRVLAELLPTFLNKYEDESYNSYDKDAEFET
jgi:hypothetical protein